MSRTLDAETRRRLLRQALRNLNKEVDPGMIGIEYADAKQGNHIAPARLRHLRADLARAESLGRLPTRIARHVPRRAPTEAA